MQRIKGMERIALRTSIQMMPQKWSRYLGLLLVALGLFLTTPASAEIGLNIRLVSEVTAVVPGQPFRLGLFIQHEPGYHTYWKFPGIVGVPTTIEWQLPEGFKAGELEYPEPEPTMMFQIKAQGYERDVLLQTEIIPPTNLKPGQKVLLKGKTSWMCCARTCHPGTKDLAIELTVAGTNSLNPQWHPIFAKERSLYVQTTTAWKASAEENDMQVILRLTPVQGLAQPFPDSAAAAKVVFFTEDGWINSDGEQKVALTQDGGIEITLERSEVFLGKEPPSKLYGILRRPDGWLAGGIFLRSIRIAPALRQ